MPRWFGAMTGASDEPSHGHGGGPKENQPHDHRHESQDELGGL